MFCLKKHVLLKKKHVVNPLTEGTVGGVEESPPVVQVGGVALDGDMVLIGHVLAHLGGVEGG